MSIQCNGKHYLLPVVLENKDKGGTISDFIIGAESALNNHSEYKDVSDDNKFKKIMLYNSTSEPYYQSKVIYNYLYPGSKDHSAWVKKKFKKNENHISKYLKQVPICIPKDGVTLKQLKQQDPKDYYKKDNVILLTELG